MKKFILFFLLISVFFVKQVFAADFNVVCNGSGSCVSTGEKPVFSDADGFWYPGRILEKTISFSNTSNSDHMVALEAVRQGSTSIIEDVMNINIMKGSILLWSGKLSDFYKAGEIYLEVIKSNQNSIFEIHANMDETAGNKYQNTKSVFDLTIGFKLENGVGGDGGSGTVSTPTCDDPAPQSAPKLISTTAGNNSVTLKWIEAQGPLTYYLLSFRDIDGHEYGSPYIGAKGTTTYTVRNLPAAKPYYFKIRAGNGCTPGAFSNEIFAGAIGISTTPSVLSSYTENLSTPNIITQCPAVKSACCCLKWLIWILLLHLLVFIFKVFYKRRVSRK